MLGEFTMKVISRAIRYEYKSAHRYSTVEDAVVAGLIHALRESLMLFSIIVQNGDKQEKMNLTVSRAS